jgi:hypothetical protein
MKRLRVLSRRTHPDGSYVFRVEGGRSAIVADGTADGDGWTWATLDDSGGIIQTGYGCATSREAKLAARHALRLT